MPSAGGSLTQKTAVVIPCYNAENYIAEVIEGVMKYIPPARIIVVDDGSEDSTTARAKELGTTVLAHPRNLGKGAALISGVEEAGRMGMEYVITIDADGQHNPDHIPAFIAEAERGGADIIVGNRMGNPQGMPWLRKLSNRLTSLVLSLRTGLNIPDSQSGYRLMRVSLLAKMKLVTRRYETESEILIKSALRGAAISSVPIETIYGTAPSSINPMTDTLRFFSMVIRSFFW